MKATKQYSGQYKVTAGSLTFVVAKVSYGWEVWDNERTDENCWACGFPTKKDAINAIKDSIQ